MRIARRFAVPPGDVREAARATVEAWGGEWEEEGARDRVRLPIQAGLRRALATGTMRAADEGRETCLELELEPSSWSLHLPGVAVLLLATLAAIPVVLWPFFPALGPLVPLGLLAALGAWFLVVARLQNRGAEELLDTVASQVEGVTQ